MLHTCAGKYDSCPNYKHYNKDTTLLTIDIVCSYSVLHAMDIKQPGREESKAFTMVLLDLLSLHTNLYTILRITDWQHWVFVVAQVALVLSYLNNPMFILNMLW